jgi:hypothetical protein
MAALLTEPEQKAARLTKAISKMPEVYVVSVPGETRLRVQLFQCQRNYFLGWLAEHGWSAVFMGLVPRITEMGKVMCEQYEVDVREQLLSTLPTDARRIPDDEEKK